MKRAHQSITLLQKKKNTEERGHGTNYKTLVMMFLPKKQLKDCRMSKEFQKEKQFSHMQCITPPYEQLLHKRQHHVIIIEKLK